VLSSTASVLLISLQRFSSKQFKLMIGIIVLPIYCIVVLCIILFLLFYSKETLISIHSKRNPGQHYHFTAGRLGPDMNKTGLILINGRQEKLAYGTSVKQRSSIPISFTLEEYHRTLMMDFLRN
jgi:hypothetical protein